MKNTMGKHINIEKPNMLFSEQVFAWWDAQTLLQYSYENWLNWTADEVFLLLQVFDSAPTGFISVDGNVAIDTPYWNENDLQSDLAIIKTDKQDAYVEETLTLDHENMCKFLCDCLEEAKKCAQQP